MIQEFAIALFAGDNPKESAQVGDILLAPTQARIVSVWDEMIARGRRTHNDREAAIVSGDILRWPWGTEDLKRYLIVVSEDEFTDAELESYISPVYKDSGLLNLKGDPIINMDLKRKFKIIPESTGLSGKTLEDIYNKDKAVMPRYDKPISKTLIMDKVK